MSRVNSSRRVSRIVRICLWILGGLVLAGLAFIPFAPSLDGPHSRQLANEASAVSKLHKIRTLQDEYAASHAEKGFACDLPLLRATDQPKASDYDPLQFLVTEQSGYKFALANCYGEANRRVTHYQATATPVVFGSTGFRAFCTDDSGLIWYDSEGSAAKCLASRRSLE
jgi:hypothetical protein